jgi:hypothetical protein
MSEGFDPVGLAATGRALEKATGAVMEGAGAVLSRICLPAAEELGFLLRDKMAYYRTRNLVAIEKKLEKILKEQRIPEGTHAHPRVVFSIADQGSLVDDSLVQEMWAGLLSSSCTENGDDDSNWMFTKLLGDLSKLQARILKYSCETARKTATPSGLIYAGSFAMSLNELCEMAQEKDIHRLDRELDHLHALKLIEGGLPLFHERYVPLTPTSLALHMYVRCCGSRLSPTEFFKIEVPKPQRAEEVSQAQVAPANDG